VNRRLAFLRRRPAALIASAEAQLAFLEREYGFEREEGRVGDPQHDARHPSLAHRDALLFYRRGDEVLKLTRHATPFLAEAIFLEWFPAVMPKARYLYTGMIERGTREVYDRELAHMVESLKPDLKTAFRLWRESVGG